MFFDTNIVILYLLNTLEERESSILLEYIINKNSFISNMVVAEVLAYSGYTDADFLEVKSLLYKEFKIVYVNEKITIMAASIARLQKQKTGKKLKLTDAIIAATAIEKGIPLLTLDREDFKNVEGLSLI